MNLTDIERQVDGLIKTDEVVGRLFKLACVQHKKSAGWDGGTATNCGCDYCQAIKHFIHAKIRLNRADRGRDWQNLRPTLSGAFFEDARQRYIVALDAKNQAKQNLVDF